MPSARETFPCRGRTRILKSPALVGGFFIISATFMQIESEHGNSNKLLFSWPPKSLWMMTGATKSKDACSLEEKL